MKEFIISADIYSPAHVLIHAGTVKEFTWVGNGNIVKIEYDDNVIYYASVNNVVIQKRRKEK